MEASAVASNTKKSPIALLAKCLKNLAGKGCQEMEVKKISPQKLQQESADTIYRMTTSAIEMSVELSLPAPHIKAARVNDAFKTNFADRENLSKDLAGRTVAKIAVENPLNGKLVLFRTDELSRESARIIAQELSAHIDRVNGILENPADQSKSKALKSVNSSLLKTLAEHGLRLCVKHKEGFLIRLTEDERQQTDLNLTSVKLTQSISVSLISALSDPLTYMFRKAS